MITITARTPETWWGKTIGLLTTKTPEALLLQTRWGIHTFGMKYPIDAVVLDNKDQVISFKFSIKPNRFYIWNPKYNKVLELPAGTIEMLKLKKGDKVSLKILE